MEQERATERMDMTFEGYDLTADDACEQCGHPASVAKSVLSSRFGRHALEAIEASIAGSGVRVDFVLASTYCAWCSEQNGLISPCSLVSLRLTSEEALRWAMQLMASAEEGATYEVGLFLSLHMPPELCAEEYRECRSCGRKQDLSPGDLQLTRKSAPEFALTLVTLVHRCLDNPPQDDAKTLERFRRTSYQVAAVAGAVLLATAFGEGNLGRWVTIGSTCVLVLSVVTVQSLNLLHRLKLKSPAALCMWAFAVEVAFGLVAFVVLTLAGMDLGTTSTVATGLFIYGLWYDLIKWSRGELDSLSTASVVHFRPSLRTRGAIVGVLSAIGSIAIAVYAVAHLGALGLLVLAVLPLPVYTKQVWASGRVRAE